MRKELASFQGQSRRFRGTIKRYGTRRSFSGAPIDTVLLVNLTDVAAGQIVADHVWLTVGKQIRRLAPCIGEQLEFTASVKSYTKGYFGRRPDVDKITEQDLGLSRHRDLKRLDSDGLEVDVNGPPRASRTEEGWFAVGCGLRYPCASEAAALERVFELTERHNKRTGTQP